MKRTGMHWLLVAIVGVLGRGIAGAETLHPQDRPTAGCPPGQEPTGAPSGSVGTCRACPPGTFSAGNVSCSAHTRCWAGNRLLVALGTAATDSRCGTCRPGFYSPDGDRDPRGRCLPCIAAPRSTPGCPGWRRPRSPETREQSSGTNRTRVTPPGGEEEEAAAARAAVLALVPVFCALGLLGTLLCHLLKRRGCRCSAAKDPPHGGAAPGSVCRLEEADEDTIGVLVRLITEKRENAAALEELLREHRSRQLLPPAGCSPLSGLHLLPQFPPDPQHRQHLHTVQGAAPCARCSRSQWPQLLPPAAAKGPGAGGRPGDLAVLSVGRFRVSRIPEVRSEGGGDPLRGPLPTGSGMWPPWLGSTAGAPELVPGPGGQRHPQSPPGGEEGHWTLREGRSCSEH